MKHFRSQELHFNPNHNAQLRILLLVWNGALNGKGKEKENQARRMGKKSHSRVQSYTYFPNVPRAWFPEWWFTPEVDLQKTQYIKIINILYQYTELTLNLQRKPHNWPTNQLYNIYLWYHGKKKKIYISIQSCFSLQMNIINSLKEIQIFQCSDFELIMAMTNHTWRNTYR